jgi:hypothetical protein
LTDHQLTAALTRYRTDEHGERPPGGRASLVYGGAEERGLSWRGKAGTGDAKQAMRLELKRIEKSA